MALRLAIVAVQHSHYTNVAVGMRLRQLNNVTWHVGTSFVVASSLKCLKFLYNRSQKLMYHRIVLLYFIPSW